MMLKPAGTKGCACFSRTNCTSIPNAAAALAPVLPDAPGADASAGGKARHGPHAETVITRPERLTSTPGR